MQTQCPLPSGTDYGPVVGMVRGETPRQTTPQNRRASPISPHARRFSSVGETPATGPPLLPACILCGLVFVLAVAVASFARELSAL
jgi:hypothetical protein